MYRYSTTYKEVTLLHKWYAHKKPQTYIANNKHNYKLVIIDSSISLKWINVFSY